MLWVLCFSLAKSFLFWVYEISSLKMSHVDLEQGGHRLSVSRSEASLDESVSFSDAEDESCYSQFYSTNGGSYDEYSFSFVCDPQAGAISDSCRTSSVSSECSIEIDVETGLPEIKVHLDKVDRDCRICHLGLESNSHESGVPIVLGCSCKDDLGSAHKNCAEAWFKIRGNKTCEICHSIARNVIVAGVSEMELTEQSNESSNNEPGTTTVTASTPPTESRNFWQGHRFLNFLLACMAFAFVISWLFHFNVPSS